MGRLRKVITSEQFQQLSNDILRGMDINKQEYCNADHHTLQEAKDRLNALQTNIMMGDVGYILDKSIKESKEKMTVLSKARNQLDNQKKIATSKKANKGRLIHLLETAKRTLIDSLQRDLQDQIDSAETKNSIREDTIKNSFDS